MEQQTLPIRLLEPVKPISIAVLAMGGQGGGVLTDWIVASAESQGWAAQSTSVPGVAQRTGATIYYIEMLPPRDGKLPVFSLMPTPGDVDIVLAAEYMEAGRAMLRGLVSPDKTTLIASNHRALAVHEKQVPGDGRGSSNAVTEATEIAAKRVIAFDMQTLAEGNRSVISAALLGALAASNVLPFPRGAYEVAIKDSGRGADASQRTFSAAFDRVRNEGNGSSAERSARPAQVKPSSDFPADSTHDELNALVSRIRAFPTSTQQMAFAGVRRLVDYQDASYARAYLDRLEEVLKLDRASGGPSNQFAFTSETAKYLAVALSYDDLIRVADLKTRKQRFDRIRREIGIPSDHLIYTTEYMHPRAEEVIGSLPARIGRFITARPRLTSAIDRRINKGRRIRSGTVLWFLILFAIGQAKWSRRHSLRYAEELAHIEQWLTTATTLLPTNYALATEIIRCRRLIKGYSDTHSRGLSKFEKVMAMVPRLVPVPDAAAWLRRFRDAALSDEKSEALQGAILTFDSAFP